MKFRVIKCCYEDATGVSANGADFLLEEDGWNDFWYYTLYHLHATNSITGHGNELVGFVRIMKVGQKVDEMDLLRKQFGDNLFSALPDNFVSLSNSVNTWRNIERLLSHDQRLELVKALNIITSKHDKEYEQVKDSECFKMSLLRDTNINDYALKLAREILENSGRHYDLISNPMFFRLPQSDEPIALNFSIGNAKLDKIKDVPSRLLAFIGNNGVGKSTILYRLIKIFFSSPDVRELHKKEFGEVSPNDVGFSRLFLISYSALDNFTLPGMSASEIRGIVKGIDDGYGRLVFCGLRDVSAEYQDALDKAEVEGKDIASMDKVDTEHVGEIRLKSVSTLAREFADALESIDRDKSKRDIWDSVIEDFSELNSDLRIFSFNRLSLPFLDDRVESFLKQSTGLKFILHSLAILIDRIEWNSIILFDEPENHLQPPMLSKLLKTLRLVAHNNASLIMVATHSPVILQETFGKNVVIVSRVGDIFSFRNPEIETYGENIGAIINEVFGLNSKVTSYFDVADKMLRKGVFEDKKCLNMVGSEIRAYLAGKV